MSHPKSRTENLRIADTEGGGLAIYDESSDDGHLLNPTAAIVYKLADGTRSIETIAEQLAARTGAPVEQDLVLLALDELDRACLLKTDNSAPRPTIHRRRFLARLGVIAGITALVPLVDTVTQVSQAAAHTLRTTMSPTTARCHTRRKVTTTPIGITTTVMGTTTTQIGTTSIGITATSTGIL